MLIKQNKVEKWAIFEVELNTTDNFDNPFTDVSLAATFKNGSITKQVEGFYDGDSTWKIRFMPEETGVYTFTTISNQSNLHGLEGSFESIAPSPKNHGPVRVANQYHFSYADGTPLFIMGTTAYAWTYRPEEVRKQTLASFSKYKFNKIRMLFFPKNMTGFDEIDLTYEPPVLPFEGNTENFDFIRFNVEYFRNFEERVKDLLELGIEADVILFHNYDRAMWNIDARLNNEDGIFYVKYLMARISAFRNVWWSLANEYDLVRDPDAKCNFSGFNRRNWDAVGEYLMQNDPYNHLRSIHNWVQIYPDRDWITHLSIQRHNTYALLMDLKYKYGKPVVNDEYQYEGNLSYRWGNLTGAEALFKHWLSVMAGGYATHGECYVVRKNKKDIFWTYGGTMIGQSAPRLKLLKEIVDTLPFQQMEPDHTEGDGIYKFCLKKEREAYLYYITTESKDDERNVKVGNKHLGDTNTYEITAYDTWNSSVIYQEVKQASVSLVPSYPVPVAVKVVKVST